MMTRKLVIGLTAAVSLVAVSLSSRADEEFLATVIRELPQAAVSLQQAVKTSESEDGELQISVYTSQGEQFDEVTIDPKSGSIKKCQTAQQREGDRRRSGAECRAGQIEITSFGGTQRRCGRERRLPSCEYHTDARRERGGCPHYPAERGRH